MDWISVKDKLPEDCSSYLVCLENKAIFECQFSIITEDARWFHLFHKSFPHKENPITHWMSLPEPPK